MNAATLTIALLSLAGFIAVATGRLHPNPPPDPTDYRCGRHRANQPPPQ